MLEQWSEIKTSKFLHREHNRNCQAVPPFVAAGEYPLADTYLRHQRNPSWHSHSYESMANHDDHSPGDPAVRVLKKKLKRPLGPSP